MVWLPGIIGACCGHGVREGHLVFQDGRIIRGQFEPDPAYPDAWPTYVRAGMDKLPEEYYKLKPS